MFLIECISAGIAPTALSGLHMNIERFCARFRQPEMHFRDRDHHVCPIVVHRYRFSGPEPCMQYPHAVVLQILPVMHRVNLEHIA
jgi:hypothetical protein